MAVWQGISVLVTLCVIVDGGVVSAPKPGKCPPKITMKEGYDCTKETPVCTADNHCQGIFKCCHNGCIKECLVPIIAMEDDSLIARTAYQSYQAEAKYSGSCNTTKDCPKYSKCLDEICACMYGITEQNEHGHVSKCRASLLFSEHDDTTSLLVALGISLLIFFGYFAGGTCLLFAIKRIRHPHCRSTDLNSALAKHGISPGETTPLHSPTGQNDHPSGIKQGTTPPSTSEKKGINDNVML